MSFLTSKGESSNLNSSLRHDSILSTTNQYAAQQQQNQRASFRSRGLEQQQQQDQNQAFEHFTHPSSSSSLPSSSSVAAKSTKSSSASFLPSSQIPPTTVPAETHLTLAAMSPSDGSEVLALLEDPSGAYETQVNGDDLIADSMSYHSYRHQADQQHSITELEKQRQRLMEDWILSDDIISYIEKQDSTYIDDVYGLPPMIAKLVKEAKEEIQQDKGEGQQKAVSRLQMIRDHLIGRSQGNRALAVQQGLQMKNDDDWASLF